MTLNNFVIQILADGMAVGTGIIVTPDGEYNLVER